MSVEVGTRILNDKRAGLSFLTMFNVERKWLGEKQDCQRERGINSQTVDTRQDIHNPEQTPPSSKITGQGGEHKASSTAVVSHQLRNQ